MEIAAWVVDRASADELLGDEAKLLILAALDGDVELDQMLAAADFVPVERDAESVADVEPTRAFVKSVVVQAFRGIGPKATLALDPCPGLVVIAGRNGSGKSSFAEALEMALTGATYRWRKRSALWSDNWRNLHGSGPCTIRVNLVAEGAGATQIGLDWPVDADLTAFSSWVQKRGSKRQAMSALGWREALELYRPVLSYDELSGMLETEPSRLFDALEGFLGLEQITDAGERLGARLKTLADPQKQAAAKKSLALSSLASVDDPRAAAASKALKMRPPDLAAVRRLVTADDGSQADPQLGNLRAAARLQLPTAYEVTSRAELLRLAVAANRSATESLVDVLTARTEILDSAVRYHQQHGDGPCPVCEVGTLDTARAASIDAELSGTRAQLALVATTRRQLDGARSSARALVAAGPAILASELGLASQAAARTAWERWADAPSDDVGLIAHLLTTHPQASITALTTEADGAATARQDAWSEVVVPLTVWFDAASRAADVEDARAVVEAAAKWIATNMSTLRNERLEPLADKAREIWADLRQESNVDLGAIRLEGAKTRRHVDLRAQVDGSETGALPVMSQGELHALALALFIPRATSDASPFGFIVLDDPIQAMDPSKIDGFVRVLGKLAHDRQVIVFSHDDRLPEAVRRSSIPGRILEITRGSGSEVRVATSSDPASRYLDDAWAVARDDGLEDDDKSRVIPGLCRLALESACRDVFYGRQLTAGVGRAGVESDWQGAHLTGSRLELALDRDGADFDRWLNAKPRRKRALGICTSAAHGGLYGDATTAVNAVRDLVADVRAVK